MSPKQQRSRCSHFIKILFFLKMLILIKPASHHINYTSQVAVNELSLLFTLIFIPPFFLWQSKQFTEENQALGTHQSLEGLDIVCVKALTVLTPPWGTTTTQIVCFDLTSSAAMENSTYSRVKWFSGAAWAGRRVCHPPGRVSLLKPALAIPWEDCPRAARDAFCLYWQKESKICLADALRAWPGTETGQS